MKMMIAAMALIATQAMGQCERETRAQHEATRGRDAQATKQAKADLAACRDADRSRYRTVDNPVGNDGPPPRRPSRATDGLPSRLCAKAPVPSPAPCASPW